MYRIEQFERDVRDILARLGKVEDVVAEIREDSRDLRAEVGNVPAADVRAGRPPITERLHNLEAQTSPIAMQAAIQKAIDNNRAAFWTRGQKLVTVAGVIIGAAAGVLRLLGVEV